MKSVTTMLILFSNFFGVSDDYEKTKSDIMMAVESRNFVEVKELLTELMPLMRKDLKASKVSLRR